jgi:FSR family fosmidomycin resistance protein-like MFS transporter
MSASSRLAIAFSCIGHFLHHVLTGLFLTLVIVLERVWERPFDELIGLWAMGAFLIGAGAPLAGWLADRFGHDRMMASFFLGAGAATIAAGLTAGPGTMTLALCGLGLFGAIYHPVGLAWVTQAAPLATRGRVMGLVGIAGSLGVAAAALVAGGLAALFGWRVALMLPGAVTLATGMVLAILIALGRFSAVGHVTTATGHRAPPDDVATPERTPLVVMAVLFVTLACGSILFNAFSTAAPKWLSEALGTTDMARIGALVGLVFLFGSIAHLIGGWLADRVPLKPLYVASFAVKLPLLLVAGLVGGWQAVAVAAAFTMVMDIGVPAENLLLARYSSGRRRGLAFGIKYAMGFIAAPLGVGMVAALHGVADLGFLAMFLVLAGLTLAMLLAALALPGAAAAQPLRPQALPAE